MSLPTPPSCHGCLRNPNRMKLKRSNQDDHGFQELVKKLDAELAIRDGDDHAFYHQFNGITQLNHVVLCMDQDKAVACGAFKARTAQQVEIKRMYVLPDYRRQGLAEQVLIELEKWGAALGYEEAVLETGKAQVEALSFYPKMKYRIIPNFPPYEGVENSVCFQKFLL